jgi:hypothetical protein
MYLFSHFHYVCAKNHLDNLFLVTVAKTKRIEPKLAQYTYSLSNNTQN